MAPSLAAHLAAPSVTPLPHHLSHRTRPLQQAQSTEPMKLFDIAYGFFAFLSHSIAFQVPGIYKIRHIGQTTLSFTAVSAALSYQDEMRV